jgi:serine/threonine protein kinase/tetratricopeptide (TPR) repeat protein
MRRMLRTGARLGPYEIQSTLGAGGMGEVYRARDTRLDRTVAIKVLLASLASDPQSRERFHREARTISQLDHPNVCALYDVGEHEGASYLVMQHLEGETLRDRIVRGPLPVDSALSYAIEIAGALAKAHSAGIVHRDLKPANVMITASGAKLLDFGIAKLLQNPARDLDEAATADLRTEAGIVVGTVRYMSPEQARGLSVDARSDIFSFGVMLYEMLAGRPPFDGATSADVIAAILERQPPQLTSYRPGVPSEVERVVIKCAEKVQTRRYSSAEELAQDLAAVKRSIAARPQKQIPSIAVLPFVNMSTDPENEYFCDGIAEDLINALTKIDRVRVVARTTPFSFKGKTGDVREIGRTLNVTSVLEGSVRKAGNRLRVSAQLVNVADGYHVWSDRYDRQMEDVFEIQDEISMAIVNALKVKLLGGEREALAKRQTVNVDAYQLYLQGRHHWHKWSAASFARSMECMKRAIDIDPEYALAYCGIADVYLGGATGYHRYVDILPHAQAALRRALDLDPELDEAWLLTAVAHMFEWNWQTAERAAARAIELNPRSGHAYQASMLIRLYQGFTQEALEQAKRAVELDPLAQLYNWSLAWALMAVGDYDDAVARNRVLLDIDPSFWMGHLMKGALLAARGAYAEAVQSLEEAVRLSGDAPYAIGYLACLLALAGERERAQALIAPLLAASATQYVYPLAIACASFGLGDLDQAFYWFNRCIDDKDVFTLTHLRYDPVLAPLRLDPRMAALFARL